MINESLRPPCILPLLIHTSAEAAQAYFNVSIGMSTFVCVLFLPCLLFLVVIQIQNFMLNQTTNTRFSKFKRNGLSEAQITALQEHETSDSDEQSMVFVDRFG
jgi:hypothetical protein